MFGVLHRWKYGAASLLHCFINLAYGKMPLQKLIWISMISFINVSPSSICTLSDGQCIFENTIIASVLVNG